MTKKKNLSSCIRAIPDFPKPGILFRDITTLLKDRQAFAQAVDELAEHFSKEKVDFIVAMEARGFIFGATLAYKLGAGFVPVRKKGKLPAKVRSQSYSLEYGTDTLEIHEDALKAGDRTLIVDDLLATGGTAKAVADLVKQSGAKIIAITFLIELTDLAGIEKLKGYPVFSLIKY